MKSFPTSFDFEKYKEASKSQFPVFILAVALAFNWLAIAWLWAQIERPHPEIAAVVGLSALMWALVVYNLHKARKKLLHSNLQRERAENALLDSEAHFRELFENANDLVYTTDLRGNFTSLNKSGERLTGYSAKEACRMNFADVVAPEFQELIRQNLNAALGGKVAPACRIEMLRSDGEPLALEISNRLVTENGAPVGIQGIARDVAERQKLEDELRASEQRYRAFIEQSSEGIWRFDFEEPISGALSVEEQVTLAVRYGYLAECNDAMAQMHGLSRAQELRGMRIKDLFVLSETANQEFFAAFISQNYRLTDAESHADEGDRYFLNNLMGIVEDGNLVSAWGTQRDITERRRAEELLRAADERVRALINNAPLLLFAVDAAGKITMSEGRGLTSLGLKPGEAVGLSIFQSFGTVEFIEGCGKISPLSQIVSRALSGEIISGVTQINGAYHEHRFTPQINEFGQVVGMTSLSMDVTQSRRAEEALKRAVGALDATSDGVFMFREDTLKFFYVNEGAIRQTGYSREELLEMTLLDLKPEVGEKIFRRVAASLIKKTRSSYTFKSFHRRKDKTEVPVEIILQYDSGGHGESVFVAMVRDITERVRTEDALRESENNLRSLLENMNEGLVQVDEQQIIRFVNDRFCEMTGYCRDELVGKTNFDIFLDEEGQRRVAEANVERLKGLSGHYEVRLKKKNGEILWTIVGGAPMLNAEGAVTGTMGVFTDITERKRAEEKLLHDAFHDSLTGLANRTLFINHLQMEIARGKRETEALYAVLFLDFDRFKVINDSLGHTEGDRLLQQVARRLKNSVRAGDLVARLGGDEFTILLNSLEASSDAVLVAERIQNDLKAPFDLGGGEVFMSASIGITLSTAGHQSAGEMLRDADIAMYRAKAKGKAQYQVFDREMHTHAMSQLKLETELRRALKRKEFRLHYQPIMNLQTASIIGFEALIRWRHPKRGLISPGEFIPAAEENGLILPIGWWILREACRRMREWQSENPVAAALTISVNLSSKQFLQFDLADRVAEILAVTRLDPRCLKLEITESHVMENSEMAVTMMNRLRALGVELSLDDFGTGYSSLSYLHRLPVSTLKIDRTFVTRMMESRENAEIVFTVIKLAQNLKMKVIAEGVETAEQFERLRQIGCEFGQGYFFSKPLEAKSVAEFIKEKSDSLSFLPETQALNAEAKI